MQGFSSFPSHDRRNLSSQDSEDQERQSDYLPIEDAWLMTHRLQVESPEMEIVTHDSTTMAASQYSILLSELQKLSDSPPHDEETRQELISAFYQASLRLETALGSIRRISTSVRPI